MEGIFEVTDAGQVVGTVDLTREGLYCRMVCRCRVRDGKIHRLYAGEEKIGVLVPEGASLFLETRVAAKRLKEGCRFCLDPEQETVVSIQPEEAFPFLDKVRYGKLVLREGKPALAYNGQGK